MSAYVTRTAARGSGGPEPDDVRHAHGRAAERCRICGANLDPVRAAGARHFCRLILEPVRITRRRDP